MTTREADGDVRGAVVTRAWTRDPRSWAGRHHGAPAAVGDGALAGTATL
jgi:hypothetical protein